MPRYRFGRRASSLANLGVVVTPVSPEPTEPEPSYRDLQAEAKDAGIPANQSAEELKAALGKSDE